MWLGFGADFRADVGIDASKPVEQAYPLVFLCSDAAAGITGITMITDAGYFAAGVTGSFPAAKEAIRVALTQPSGSTLPWSGSAWTATGPSRCRPTSIVRAGTAGARRRETTEPP